MFNEGIFIEQIAEDILRTLSELDYSHEDINRVADEIANQVDQAILNGEYND